MLIAKLDIEKKIYYIWKEGFDAEKLEQYDFSDNVVNLKSDVQELESELTRVAPYEKMFNVQSSRIRARDEEIKKLKAIVKNTESMLKHTAECYKENDHHEELITTNLITSEFFDIKARGMGKKHNIKVKSYGHGEMGCLQNWCSCGWVGRVFFAHEDLQVTLCREERENHLRSGGMTKEEIRDKMYAKIELLTQENARLIDQRSALAYKCDETEKAYIKCSRENYELNEQMRKYIVALGDIKMNCGVIDDAIKVAEETLGC